MQLRLSNEFSLEVPIRFIVKLYFRQVEPGLPPHADVNLPQTMTP